MPRNLDRLDLTRPERRALLGRLLDIIDGESAVGLVGYDAQHAAEEAEQRTDEDGTKRQALISDALASARAALPGMESLLRIAEEDLSEAREREQRIRQLHSDRPTVFRSFEDRIAAQEREVEKTRQRLGTLRGIIERYAPDGGLVAKHAADYHTAGVS